MKRIQTACLLQTIHFQLKEDLPHEEAVQGAQEEYERYKAHLNHSGVRFFISKEETLPDGSILIHIRRQYNAYPGEEYLKAD